jgi:hypothetical protein
MAKYTQPPMKTPQNKSLIRWLAGSVIVLFVFALGLWTGWHKDAIFARLWHGHGKVESKASPFSSAADFAEYAMKLREQESLKVQPRVFIK